MLKIKSFKDGRRKAPPILKDHYLARVKTIIWRVKSMQVTEKPVSAEQSEPIAPQVEEQVID